MHDPLVTLAEIRRPWPRSSQWYTETAARTGKRWEARGAYWVIAGHGIYWPLLITIWHQDPGGADSGTVCRRGRRAHHLHHLSLQIHPYQRLRRRLLTRCEICGGRSTRQRPVDLGTWSRPKSPWWRGERGLKHMDCAAAR